MKIFKPEHFEKELDYVCPSSARIADIANKILTDYVKTLPDVYNHVVTQQLSDDWCEVNYDGATVTAHLIDLRNIETERE